MIAPESADRIATVEKRANVDLAQPLQETAQIRHRHPLCLADADSAQNHRRHVELPVLGWRSASDLR